MYLVLGLLFFLQLTLSGFLRLFGASPDLGCLFVVFVAIFFGWETAAEAGLVFGLLKDMYSLDTFGVNAVSLSITGIVCGALGPKIFRESRTTQSLVVFFFTLLYLFIHYSISSPATAGYISLGEYTLLSFFPVALYTSVISLIVFPPFMEWFGLKEDAEYL
jgi:rod shape-determining protein MreD